LELKKNTENLIHKNNSLTNTQIIPPCFIGEGAIIDNCVIGPYVSVEANATIKNSIVKNSIIRNDATINDAILNKSLIGTFSSYKGNADNVSLGDYSSIE
jgi:glucose-1-phosphate thymidylyltransferase